MTVKSEKHRIWRHVVNIASIIQARTLEAFFLWCFMIFFFNYWGKSEIVNKAGSKQASYFGSSLIPRLTSESGELMLEIWTINTLGLFYSFSDAKPN